MEHFRNSKFKGLDLHASQNIHFEFKDLNFIFLPSTVSKTFVPENLCLPLFISLILNIFNVSFSSSLIYRHLSTCHKVISIAIGQNLQFRLCWVKLISKNQHVTALLIKVPPLKGGVDWILKIQNTLLTHPITLII